MIAKSIVEWLEGERHTCEVYLAEERVRLRELQEQVSGSLYWVAIHESRLDWIAAQLARMATPETS